MLESRKSPSSTHVSARFAIWAAFASVFLVCSSEAKAEVKVACIGDSITYGYGLNPRDSKSYPAVLQTLLGEGYTVTNFGVSGTTLLKMGDNPYWNTAAFTQSTSFAPNIAVIMLGTNDAKPQNWQNAAEFDADYKAMIQHYRDLGAQVYAALPPPVYDTGAFDISPTVLNDDIVPRIRQIAGDTFDPLIDVFGALSDQPELFPDTVHPNEQGAELIAQTVYAALMSDSDAGVGGAPPGDASAGNSGISGGGANFGNGGSAGIIGGGNAAAGTANRGEREGTSSAACQCDSASGGKTNASMLALAGVLIAFMSRRRMPAVGRFSRT